MKGKDCLLSLQMLFVKTTSEKVMKLCRERPLSFQREFLV